MADGNSGRNVAARAKALEQLLISKGLIDPAALDAIVEAYANRIGPRNGAAVVARAWVDAQFRSRLLADATAATAEMGFTGIQGAHIRALENSPLIHNVVVCTLCSCYPWPLLGLPPSWYKSLGYRSRIVSEPREVLAEFGLRLEPEIRVQVWDSTAEIRYIVIPERPQGTEGWSVDALAALVTRDAMIGAARVASPEDAKGL